VWELAERTPRQGAQLRDDRRRRKRRGMSFTLVEVFGLDGEYAENQMNLSKFCVKQRTIIVIEPSNNGAGCLSL
jgi:hypothetical protein